MSLYTIQMIPTWAQLLWIPAVLCAAVLLGALYAVIDTVVRYGWPKRRSAQIISLASRRRAS